MVFYKRKKILQFEMWGLAGRILIGGCFPTSTCYRGSRHEPTSPHSTILNQEKLNCPSSLFHMKLFNYSKTWRQRQTQVCVLRVSSVKCTSLLFTWIYWFKKVELRGCDVHKEGVGPIWFSSGVVAMFHLKDPTSCPGGNPHCLNMSHPTSKDPWCQPR